MRRTHKGYFTPKNPNKLLSNKRIIFRSSWERKFCEFCDTHPNIIQWASEHEDIKIPYFNPLQNKWTVYVPDFFVVYQTKTGKKKIELIEIKPAAETYISEARSNRHKAALAVNVAKWKAAQEWCERKGIHFRVVTEHDIFRNPKKRKR